MKINTPRDVMLVPDFQPSGDAEKLGEELTTYLGDMARAIEGTFKFVYYDFLKVGENEWSDYGTTSTIVGWSSFTSGYQKIYTKKMWNTVLVAFDLAGTSNSTSVTFTLPYSLASGPTSIESVLGYAQDNSAQIATPCRFDFTSYTVSCYTNLLSQGWTASNSKRVIGQFWYESA